jgi:hypothetical protein
VHLLAISVFVSEFYFDGITSNGKMILNWPEHERKLLWLTLRNYSGIYIDIQDNTKTSGRKKGIPDNIRTGHLQDTIQQLGEQIQ